MLNCRLLLESFEPGIRTLERARGAVAIHGSLRKADSQHGRSQIFIEWVVEMPAATDAEQLVADVGNGAPLSGRFAAGVSEGRLFALLVAGSSQEGIEPYESSLTLAELARQTKALLGQQPPAESGSAK